MEEVDLTFSTSLISRDGNGLLKEEWELKYHGERKAFQDICLISPIWKPVIWNCRYGDSKPKTGC